MIELTRDTNFCLDVSGYGTANGTKIQLWTCNVGVDQKWAPQTNGTLEAVNATSVEGHAMVLDDPSGKGNGTKLQIWEEGGLQGSNGNLNNQLWTVPSRGSRLRPGARCSGPLALTPVRLATRGYRHDIAPLGLRGTGRRANPPADRCPRPWLRVPQAGEGERDLS